MQPLNTWLPDKTIEMFQCGVMKKTLKITLLNTIE